MTGDGNSAVGRAVAQLTSSLSKSEEAQLHSSEALATVSDAWALHRRAAADTGAESMDSAVTHSAAARAKLQHSMGMLKECDEGIRRYIERIAPAMSISDSDQMRETPTGEELISMGPAKRSARSAVQEAIRKGDDVKDSSEALVSSAKGVKGLLERPPITGTSTSTPSQSPTAASNQAGQAVDPSGTIVISVVIALKGIGLGVERIRDIWRRRSP